eukprot:171659_1
MTATTWIGYLLIIVIQYSHYLSAEELLHLYYIRHVESQWNAHKFKARHRDSRLSLKGRKQIYYLYKHFGDAMYDHMESILSKEGAGYKPFQIEASTLNRAQFTALAVWKSLINTSTKKGNKKLAHNLKNAKYNIVQNLQEASAGIDAISKFDENWAKHRKKSEWLKYLARGFGQKFQKMYAKNPKSAETEPLWNDLFNNGFDDEFCKHAGYISGNFKYNVLNAIFKKKQRIKKYGENLRESM